MPPPYKKRDFYKNAYKKRYFIKNAYKIVFLKVFYKKMLIKSCFGMYFFKNAYKIVFWVYF